ncbi:MAG: trigger factor [Actinobacteria bacterium]|nr:trigger factor [Actinomycetota bacterium]MDI6831369.1 trigger factor [Actinomycetota bacterium]
MAVRAEMEEVEKNRVRVKVEVPAEEISRAVDGAFRAIAREVFIPGFRKGKVPRRVLQARLGMEPIYDEVKQSKLPEYYAEALKQLDLEPIDEPEIDVDEIEIEDGKPLAFEAVVEVKPRVELDHYKGVEVERPEEEVADEEVERVLDGMRERFAQLEVASGKTLAEGDYALIDFNGTVNGVEFEGGSARDFMLEIGTENIWPEFNQELAGKRKGDILDIRVKMPEQFPDQELAGKIASFKVIVKEVKVKKLPEANDDFAREASRFDTIAELREDIRSRLEEAKRLQAKESVRRQALEKLAEGLEVDIPEKMVDDYVHQRRHELEARLASRGIALDSYLKAVDYTEQRMEEEFQEEARRLIRNELVLDAVIRAEGIEVSDEELEQEIARRAEMFAVKPEEFRRVVKERGDLEELRESLRREKALDLLGDHAVFAGEGEKEEEPAARGEEESGAEAAEPEAVEEESGAEAAELESGAQD